MIHANVFGGLVAYLMEALCMMGAIVMLTFLRALLAEGRREAETPVVAAEQVGKMVMTDDKRKYATVPRSFRMLHS